MSPADGRHPPAPLLDAAAARQRLAVWTDRSGRVAHHGAGTVTSANLGSPGQGTRFSARRFISRSSVQGDSYHGIRCKAIHITGFGARRFISWGLGRDDSTAWSHLAGSGVEPLPVMMAGACAGWGPTRAPDSGDDTSLRVVAPTPHHGVYKRTGRGGDGVSFLLIIPVCRFCPSFLLVVPAHHSCLVWD